MKTQTRRSWVKEYFLILSSLWLIFVSYFYIEGRQLPGILNNTENLSYSISYLNIIVVILSKPIEKAKKITFAVLFTLVTSAAMYGFLVMTKSQENLGTYSMIYMMCCILLAIINGMTLGFQLILKQAKA